MKKDIAEVLRNNSVPAVVNGQDVVYFNSTQLDHVIKDLHKLFRDAKEPPKDADTESTIDEVIDKMNDTWGTKYRKKTESNRAYIRGRVRDGHSKEELFAVINHMHSRWGSDPKMSPYLRPCTIFAPSKFEGYLSESPMSSVKKLTVKDPFGNVRLILKEQYERAEEGYFTIVE